MSHLTVKNTTPSDVVLEDIGLFIPSGSSVTVDRKLFESSHKARLLPPGSFVVSEAGWLKNLARRFSSNPVVPVQVPHLLPAPTPPAPPVSNDLAEIKAMLQSVLASIEARPVVHYVSSPGSVRVADVFEPDNVILPGRIVPEADVHMTVSSDEMDSGSHDETVAALKRARKK